MFENGEQLRPLNRAGFFSGGRKTSASNGTRRLAHLFDPGRGFASIGSEGDVDSGRVHTACSKGGRRFASDQGADGRQVPVRSPGPAKKGAPRIFRYARFNSAVRIAPCSMAGKGEANAFPMADRAQAPDRAKSFAKLSRGWWSTVPGRDCTCHRSSAALSRPAWALACRRRTGLIVALCEGDRSRVYRRSARLDVGSVREHGWRVGRIRSHLSEQA